jgi:hypothetical protein
MGRASLLQHFKRLREEPRGAALNLSEILLDIYGASQL